MPGLGALYTCVVGKGETVKFFINEAENTGQVKDVKLMWNDWFKDVGYGVHADKAEMQSFVKAFSKLYAPQLEQKLISTFGGSTNATIEAGEYKIVYTYKRGPAIDERLFVLTPKRR